MKGHKVDVVLLKHYPLTHPGSLSLTSLHLSFHLLLFSVSHNPQSLLRARTLRLKLSQSGTQLRLPGDLRAEKTQDWSPSKLLHSQVVCAHQQHTWLVLNRQTSNWQRVLNF